MTLFWVLLGAAYLFGLAVQNRMRTAYAKWGNVRNSANISGSQTCHAILGANGMRDVSVHSIPGTLNDHYDPRDRSIKLSQPVYDVQSVAAMAVAAHETGHAIQHRDGYWPMSIRSALAPVVALAARFGIPAALVGLFLGSPILIQFGVIGYVGSLAFQVLSLPLEFDASRRALVELDRLGLLNEDEQEGARSVLRSAALTYVANMASSAAYIVYLALFAGRWLFGKPSAPLPPRLP